MSGQRMTRWRDIPAETRFWMRVRKTETCWHWTGSVASSGYGQMKVLGQNRIVHRFAWELHNGTIPDGLILDHLCRNKLCVRPEHLEPVTDETNIRRGVGPSAVNARKTECIRGHAFTADNTII